MDSLLFAKPRFGLAREARDVEVNVGVVNYFGLCPGVLADFEGLEVVPNELSSVGLELGGTDKDVWDAKRMEGLRRGFHA